MRSVPALDRGLAILELLSSRREPMKVSAIATALELPRSATYELVHTLKARSYVRQTPDGLVTLGPQLFLLGNSYSAQLEIVSLAQHAATAVMRRCNETVQVGMLDGREVVYIARADSTHMVRLVSAVGRRLPAHCTAIGKAMLAELDPNDLAARLQGVQLERLTPQSITDHGELMEALATARESGVSEDDRESNLEVCCVAAPVWDVTGTCVAAMSISVPLARMTPDHRAELIDEVRLGASDLSANLGFGTVPGLASIGSDS